MFLKPSGPAAPSFSLPAYLKTPPSPVGLGFIIVLAHIFSLVFTPFFFYFLTAKTNLIFYQNKTMAQVLYGFIYLVCILFTATRMRALGNIVHECCHFSFVRSKKTNVLIGSFLAVLELSSFSAYQKSHLKHHRYVGEPAHDIDFNKYTKMTDFFLEKNIYNKTVWLFWAVVFNPKNWIISCLSSFSLHENERFFIGLKIIYLVTLGVLSFYYPKDIVLFILVPFFSLYQAHKIASDFLDHHKSYFSKDKKFRTNNHIFQLRVLNLLFFPRNDAYHLVHHLYPYLPTYQLQKVHHYLLKNHKKYSEKKHSVL